ncbi:cytochrome P450 [Umbelopsis sp. PMI_123]|nr:cytochrome P450 [Umbelopsis sp. PMI_123]
MSISIALDQIKDAVNGASTRTTVLTFVVATAGWWGVQRLYESATGPLSAVPGKFIGRLIDIPYAAADIPYGHRFLNLRALHDKYGLVVRFSRTVLSVADKDMLKQVLVTDDLRKGTVYDNTSFGRPNMFNTTDRKDHRHIRRVISPAFAIRYLADLEPLLESVIDDMVEKVEGDVSLAEASGNSRAVVDLWHLTQAVALDAMGECAFGETFGMIKNGSHPLPKLVTEGVRRGAIFFTNGFLGKLLKMSGIKIEEKYLVDFMQNVIQKRMNAEAPRRDIMQILIDAAKSEKPSERLSQESVIGETMLFLFAGAETTSNTAAFALIALLQEPEKFQKLREEVDTLEYNENNHFSYESLKNAPYLNAVINETLRMRPVTAAGLERIAEQDFILGQSYHIPKGTTILANMYVAHMNPDYFDEPELFKPERWLEGYEPAPALDAFYPFSAGSRNCIGKNFALQEMRLVLSTLIKKFDFETIPESVKDAEDIRHFITLTIWKDSYKAKLSRRKDI